MLRRWIFVAPLFLGACASQQLNYNSLDIASTYDSVLSKQVALNLIRTIRNEYNIPAIAKVTTSTVSTQRSITPTFALPFTSQIANAAALVSNTGVRTTTKTDTLNPLSVNLSATDQDNQNYTLNPVYDPDQLRRLQALYRFVTQKIYSDDFEAVFPLIEASGGPAGGGGNSLTLSLNVSGHPISVTTGSSANKSAEETVYVRKSLVVSKRTGLPLDPPKYTWIQAKPDTTFIKQPGCILCDYSHALTYDDIQILKNNAYDIDHKVLEAYTNHKSIHKLERNREITNTWINLPGMQVGPDAITLYDNDFGSLSVNGKIGLKKFNELVLFTEEASTQGTGSPASGGQSEGRKTSPLERIAIPVGPTNIP